MKVGSQRRNAPVVDSLGGLASGAPAHLVDNHDES